MATKRKDIQGFNSGKSLNESINDVMKGAGTRTSKRNDLIKLGLRDGDTGTYFAHNGVLSIWPDKDKTDSETAFLNILKPEIKAHGLESDDLRYSVRQIIGGSKFAFMQGDDLRLFGDFQHYGDYLFSNLRFLYYMRDFATIN